MIPVLTAAAIKAAVQSKIAASITDGIGKALGRLGIRSRTVKIDPTTRQTIAGNAAGELAAQLKAGQIDTGAKLEDLRARSIAWIGGVNPGNAHERAGYAKLLEKQTNAQGIIYTALVFVLVGCSTDPNDPTGAGPRVGWYINDVFIPFVEANGLKATATGGTVKVEPKAATAAAGAGVAILAGVALWLFIRSGKG